MYILFHYTTWHFHLLRSKHQTWRKVLSWFVCVHVCPLSCLCRLMASMALVHEPRDSEVCVCECVTVCTADAWRQLQRLHACRHTSTAKIPRCAVRGSKYELLHRRARCIKRTQVLFYINLSCAMCSDVASRWKVSSWVSKVTATALEVWTERHLALSSRLDLRPRARFLRSISALRRDRKKVNRANVRILSVYVRNKSRLAQIEVLFGINLGFNRSSRVGGRWSPVWLMCFY